LDKDASFPNFDFNDIMFFLNWINKSENFLENSRIINLIEEESVLKAKIFLSDFDGKNIAEKDFDVENFYLKKFSKYTVKFNEFVVPVSINMTQFGLFELDCKSFFSSYLTNHKQSAFIYNCSELLNLFSESKHLFNLQSLGFDELSKNEKTIAYNPGEWKKTINDFKTLEFAIGLTETISTVTKNFLETNNTSFTEIDCTTMKLQPSIEVFGESDNFESGLIVPSKKASDFLLTLDLMANPPLYVRVVAEEFVKDFC